MVKNRKCILTISVFIIFSFAGCVAKSGHKEEGQINNRIIESSEKQQALPELKESSTLDDYVKYAELNNQGLHAAFNDWKAV